MGTISLNPEHLPRRLRELRETMGLSKVTRIIRVASAGHFGPVKNFFGK